MNTTLELAPNVSALDTAKPLSEIFAIYQTTLEKWEAQVDTIVVTDITQKVEMQRARMARLELKDARVAMDKTRLNLVAGLKARTGTIDATARAIREKMEELEARLLEQEQFAERHAAREKQNLKLQREAEIAPYLDGVPFFGDISDLSEAQYAQLLSEKMFIAQTKADAAGKQEADRLARVEAERIEHERVATENKRLKAEADRVEAERAEERRKADAAAAVERQKLAAAEAEAKKVRDTLAAKLKAEADEKARIESKRIADEKAAKEAARKAAAAPDKAKLIAFAALIRSLPVPALSDRRAFLDLTEKIEDLATWAETAIE